MSRQASGLMAWLMQRATAVYLAPCALYLLLKLVFDPPEDHPALVAWLDQPLVTPALMLAVPMALAHVWVGTRDVLIDYVHIMRLRLGLMLVCGFLYLASGLWMLKALITVGLGG